MTLVKSIISELTVFERPIYNMYECGRGGKVVSGNGRRVVGWCFGGGDTPLFWIIGGKLPYVTLYINFYEGHAPNSGPRGGVK